MQVSLSRRPDAHEVCILVQGAKHGIFLPHEVAQWLQSEYISWTVDGDHRATTFTIPDETERMLFVIKFSHLIAR